MINMDDAQKHAVISYDPLRRLLSDRNITDLQLSRMIGEKVSVVRNIQLNAKTTTIEVIRKICEALDCQPGDIMRRDDLYVIPAKKKDPDE